MAKEVHQRDVVVLLRNDVKLAKEWKFLYHNLHLMRDDTFAIERLLNQTNCPFELMNAIVGQLVSEKGSDATIRVLADALVQTQHVFIKDVLLEKFPAEAKIVSFKFEGKTGGKDADNNTAPALTKEDKLIQKKVCQSYEAEERFVSGSLC
ncbi:hypothetical protein Ocin01_10105 [Orchesella cincta]|uniref:Uncharacterized protein n=1 Tax=Orchesella cincta TaxID=48709 RepID=A0A1D2MV36_ORCCI|nr:hypothetical protein Ocin01_10105 [Orchesella cincta]